MTQALLDNPRSAVTPHRTLVDAIEASAAADAPLATFHGGDAPLMLDARTAYARALGWARLFGHHGVRRGDRVVLLVPTGGTFVCALLGAMLAGAAAVPLPTPLTFGSLEPFLRNLDAILANADARVIVTSPRLLALLRTRPSFAPPVVLTEADFLATSPRGAPLPAIDECDTALIQYTSGTTGRPKGVVIPHGALVSNAAAIAAGLGLRPTDIGVSWLPLFHDMGLVGVLLTAVCHPYALHLAAPEQFAMGAERWMRLAAQVGATITAAPNFAYERCVSRASRLGDIHLDTIRLALNGSEPVHAGTVRRFAAALRGVGLRPMVSLPVYGMAECTLAVSFAEPGDLRTVSVGRTELEAQSIVVPSTRDDAREIVTVGVPVAGTTVRVTDTDGRTSPERCVGTIRVRGTSVMDGYFRDDDASARALTDGWLDTGDLGFVDDGQLFVTGRAKDVIIHAGRNIYPYDLERVATEAGNLGAGAVVAFGDPDESVGTEAIVLVAETGEKDDARREALVRTLRGSILATLGVRVDDVRLVPRGAIPRTTSGKARRLECAARFPATGPS